MNWKDPALLLFCLCFLASPSTQQTTPHCQCCLCTHFLFLGMLPFLFPICTTVSFMWGTSNALNCWFSFIHSTNSKKGSAHCKWQWGKGYLLAPLVEVCSALVIESKMIESILIKIYQFFKKNIPLCRSLP